WGKHAVVAGLMDARRRHEGRQARHEVERLEHDVRRSSKRDRAILETLYSTGMRRRELIGLALFDLDRERGTVMVRQGKGKKDRMIPIGERAVAYIDRYQHEVRPALVVGRMNSTLCLPHTGQPFTPSRLRSEVRRGG